MLQLPASTLAQMTNSEIGNVTSVVSANQLDQTLLTPATNVSTASWLVATLWRNESLGNLTTTQLGAVPTRSLFGWRAAQVGNLTVDVYASLTAGECAALSSDGVSGINPVRDQSVCVCLCMCLCYGADTHTQYFIQNISADAFVGLCGQFDALSDDACLNVTAAQLVAKASTRRTTQLCFAT